MQKFKWRTRIAQLVSAGVLLFGLVALGLYFEPAFVGVPSEQLKLYQGRLPWLISGALFVVLGVVFLYVGQRRFSRAIWVFKNTRPIAMLSTLEVQTDSDSTVFYASLRDANDTKPRWRAWVQPTFQAQPLVGAELPAQVYVDPKFGTPAAVKLAEGVMWANPYAR